ncbi:MAG: hypothetical protein ACR2JE_00175 [Acidobacteriaceae bacterium]
MTARPVDGLRGMGMNVTTTLRSSMSTALSAALSADEMRWGGFVALASTRCGRATLGWSSRGMRDSL